MQAAQTPAPLLRELLSRHCRPHHVDAQPVQWAHIARGCLVAVQSMALGTHGAARMRRNHSVLKAQFLSAGSGERACGPALCGESSVAAELPWGRRRPARTGTS